MKPVVPTSAFRLSFILHPSSFPVSVTGPVTSLTAHGVCGVQPNCRRERRLNACRALTAFQGTLILADTQ